MRVRLAAGVTDMRKGFDGLAGLVQQRLGTRCAHSFVILVITNP
ncbi:IS66 family insertion sequence element accessory protein TnpB [Muricoccus pecuniae]|nr:IS66 family insertion sequence element accessory protein TnpB [Roseomonas pecuniae]